MKRAQYWPWVCAFGLGGVALAQTGCQTNVAGMTLPSGHYLQHPPQYIPPSPPFPLSRELSSQEAAAAAGRNIAAPAAPAPLPPPAPIVPAPGAP